MADGDQDFITPLGSFVDALSPKKGQSMSSKFWQWQQWQWKIFIAKITQIEASIIQDHDNIINDNVGKQAQWYHNFGKGGRSRYLCAPSSCIQYDSYICDEQENRVQGARKSECNLENCKNTCENTVMKIIEQINEDNNNKNKNRIRIDNMIKYGKRSW